MPSVTRDKSSQQHQAGGKAASETDAPTAHVEDTQGPKSVKADPKDADPSLGPGQSQTVQPQHSAMWKYPPSNKQSVPAGMSTHHDARTRHHPAHRVNPIHAATIVTASQLNSQMPATAVRQHQSSPGPDQTHDQSDKQKHQRLTKNGEQVQRPPPSSRVAHESAQDGLRAMPASAQHLSRMTARKATQGLSQQSLLHMPHAQQNNYFGVIGSAQLLQSPSQMRGHVPNHLAQAEHMQQQQQILGQQVSVSAASQLHHSGQMPQQVRHIAQSLPQGLPSHISDQRYMQNPMRQQQPLPHRTHPSMPPSQQHLNPSAQNGAAQFVQSSQVRQESHIRQQRHGPSQGQHKVQQLHHPLQYQTRQDMQAQMAGINVSDQGFPSQSAADYDQRYQSHRAHHPVQKERVDSVHNQKVQHGNHIAQRQQHRSEHPQHQQPQIASIPFAVGQSIGTGTPLPATTGTQNAGGDSGGTSAGNFQGNQIYQAGMAMNSPTLQGQITTGLQYPNSYASSAIFDPIALSTGTIPLAPGALGQSAPSQAVSVVRDLDNAGQHAQLQQQIHGRPALQLGTRNAIVSSDFQGYVEQAHQAAMHRPLGQGHATQDIHAHAIAQQNMSHGLYQSLDQQQNNQHLVLGQSVPFPQQQAQLGMHAQAAQLHSQAHLQTHHGQFESQQPYQNPQPSHANSTASVGVSHQNGDMQDAKAVNTGPSPSSDLVWGPNHGGGRVLVNGLAQHTGGVADLSGTTSNSVIPSSSFGPGQLFDVNIANVRQPAVQNSAHQAAQQNTNRKAHTGQNYMANVKRTSSAGAGPASPRKRRQLNSTLASPPADGAQSGRLFSCSGCGQDFTRKRERDIHVRTVHERSFSCDKCQSRFKTKSDANRHRRIVHERVRPYPCPSCPSMFSERNKLRRHKETVHEKLRPYVCPVCSARFGELGNLRQHTGSLHPDYQVDSATARNRVNNQVQS